MSQRYNESRGFTLLEVTIVLAIVGLLLAGGINLLSGSADTSKYKQTQNELQEVKESLITYYTQLKRLPCPDTDGDGIENPPVVTGTCTNIRGFLPHVTLGVGGNGDAWGERIKYVVSPKFVTMVTPPTPPSICTDNTLRVINPISDIVVVQDLQSTGQTIAEFSAFALLSTGKNGRQTNALMTGAFTNDGGCAGLNVREQENCDTDSTLRFGTQMSGGSEIIFDDMVVWVGDMQLISQLRKSSVCDSFGSSTPPPTTTPPSSDPFCDGPAAAAAKRNHGCPGY